MAIRIAPKQLPDLSKLSKEQRREHLENFLDTPLIVDEPTEQIASFTATPGAAPPGYEKRKNVRKPTGNARIAITFRLTPQAYSNLMTYGADWRKHAEKHLEEWLELAHFPP